jgi:ATP-binding cassette, subfamily B, bacterial
VSREISHIQILSGTLKLVFKAAPVEVICTLLVSLISGAGPAITLLLTKNIIDNLTKITVNAETISATFKSTSVNTVYLALALMLVITVISEAVSPTWNLLYPNMGDKVQGMVKKLLLEKVTQFKDLLIFESPEKLNLLKLAERGAAKLDELIYILFESFDGLLRLIPAVLVSTQLSWWIPLLLISCSIPFLIVESRYRFKSWMVEETQAEAIRQLDIYSALLLTEAYAKEVRSLAIQNIILKKWTDLYNFTYGKMYRMRLQGASLTFIASCVEGIGFAIPYFALVSGVINRTYTVGDLVLFSGLVLQLRGGLRLILGYMGRLFSTSLSVKPTFQFLDLELSVSSITSFQPNKPKAPFQGIQINQLSFAYPGSEGKLALKNIDLEIPNNKTVVLVGENGSGKSTLAKLICRFYEPSSGNVVWNNIDLSSIPFDDLRARMAVVFQDFSRFPASVRENIGWANLAKLDDDPFIGDILDKVKLSHVFADGEGHNTLLTKSFDGGTDLSGGQWQRMAIARALARIKDVELLILDEPTAAVDPENEHEIYTLVHQMSAHCTTIIVSHRLGLARSADHIIVLDDGMVLEEGCHTELMQRDGKYRSMFTKQMSQYV